MAEQPDIRSGDRVKHKRSGGLGWVQSVRRRPHKGRITMMVDVQMDGTPTAESYGASQPIEEWERVNQGEVPDLKVNDIVRRRPGTLNGRVTGVDGDRVRILWETDRKRVWDRGARMMVDNEGKWEALTDRIQLHSRGHHNPPEPAPLEKKPMEIPEWPEGTQVAAFNTGRVGEITKQPAMGHVLVHWADEPADKVRSYPLVGVYKLEPKRGLVVGDTVQWMVRRNGHPQPKTDRVTGVVPGKDKTWVNTEGGARLPIEAVTLTQVQPVGRVVPGVWTPKVGDKVALSSNRPEHDGAVGEIIEIGGDTTTVVEWVNVRWYDGAETGRQHPSWFKPITPHYTPRWGDTVLVNVGGEARPRAGIVRGSSRLGGYSIEVRDRGTYSKNPDEVTLIKVANLEGLDRVEIDGPKTGAATSEPEDPDTEPIWGNAVVCRRAGNDYGTVWDIASDTAEEGKWILVDRMGEKRSMTLAPAQMKRDFRRLPAGYAARLGDTMRWRPWVVTDRFGTVMRSTADRNRWHFGRIDMIETKRAAEFGTLDTWYTCSWVATRPHDGCYARQDSVQLVKIEKPHEIGIVAIGAPTAETPTTQKEQRMPEVGSRWVVRGAPNRTRGDVYTVVHANEWTARLVSPLGDTPYEATLAGVLYERFIPVPIGYIPQPGDHVGWKETVGVQPRGGGAPEPMTQHHMGVVRQVQHRVEANGTQEGKTSQVVVVERAHTEGRARAAFKVHTLNLRQVDLLRVAGVDRLMENGGRRSGAAHEPGLPEVPESGPTRGSERRRSRYAKGDDTFAGRRRQHKLERARREAAARGDQAAIDQIEAEKLAEERKGKLRVVCTQGHEQWTTPAGLTGSRTCGVGGCTAQVRVPMPGAEDGPPPGATHKCINCKRYGSHDNEGWRENNADVYWCKARRGRCVMEPIDYTRKDRRVR